MKIILIRCFVIRAISSSIFFNLKILKLQDLSKLKLLSVLAAFTRHLPSVLILFFHWLDLLIHMVPNKLAIMTFTYFIKILCNIVSGLCYTLVPSVEIQSPCIGKFHHLSVAFANSLKHFS